jgi:hypothetical protein
MVCLKGRGWEMYVERDSSCITERREDSNYWVR